MEPNKNDIKIFAKQILGCSCPDTVFKNIKWERDEYLFRIDISNRLLIYILNKNIDETDSKEIKKLLTQGKLTRDKKNFNRFRLVIPSNGPQDGERFQFILRSLYPEDDKIHLHIINKNFLKFFMNNQ